MIILADGSGGIDPAGLTAVERDIYEQKTNSPTPFHFESAEALRFELRLRANIVKAAIALERSHAGFATFSKSRANRNYWKRLDNGGFLLHPNVLPADAIRDIYENGDAYGFECATAIVIVLYKAVLDTIGETAFNRLFGNLQLYSWEHDSDMPLVTQDNNHESFAGDVLYYSNPDYDPRTPQWQGENVVKLTGDRLFGHGIGIEAEDVIIRHLNNHRRPGSKVSAYLFDRITYPDFYAIYRETKAANSGAPYIRRWPDGWIAGRVGSKTQVFTGQPPVLNA
ncbi:protein-glutamine gamma-glutamyltransferase [Paenibacillus ginsengarvi]|uniref:Protein-glutamine gamma-glutamyltransferase n=1 Tax=Paenibacillus ginsengarvi TaxID=400777 RepID=A0A3B0CK41_9BACL|nr:protein-glutamine gamma-glutamyltransferase [Paenibacillus ginsengarvi]RKN85572.1 protein-glutamine gamma-glutamyltransferase [Paenibacillus ginsengarvi]